MILTNFIVVFPNLGDIWTRFQGMFSTFNDAFAYVHAFRRYIWQMLAELYSDNVMYAEVRSTLPEVTVFSKFELWYLLHKLIQLILPISFMIKTEKYIPKSSQFESTLILTRILSKNMGTSWVSKLFIADFDMILIR